MPFTLAHPAIVLPLQRRYPRRLSLSALVIGSMSPDFAYFLPLQVGGNFSHSLSGILLFCLPTGLIAYCLFHLFCRRPLQTLLPPGLAQLAVQSERELLPCVSGPVLVFSIFIGALSHVGWDEFTHANLWLVQHWAALRTPVYQLNHYTLYLYRLLQHLSTLWGIGYITWRLYVATRSLSDTTETLTIGTGWRYALYTLFIMAGLYASVPWWHVQHLHLQQQLFFIITRGIDGILIAMLFYCLLWQTRVLWRRLW